MKRSLLFLFVALLLQGCGVPQELIGYNSNYLRIAFTIDRKEYSNISTVLIEFTIANITSEDISIYVNGGNSDGLAIKVYDENNSEIYSNNNYSPYPTDYADPFKIIEIPKNSYKLKYCTFSLSEVDDLKEGNYILALKLFIPECEWCNFPIIIY